MQEKYLPYGFQVIDPANVAIYRQWVADARNDATVRRYLSSVGWSDLATDPTPGDWSKVVATDGRSLIILSFGRTAVSEISVSLWTIGKHKKLAAGRALVAMAYLIRSYSYLQRVVSGCVTCNTESLAIHRHVFGEPWGIEPEAAWDEKLGFVGMARFALPMRSIIEKCNALIDRVEKKQRAGNPA